MKSDVGTLLLWGLRRSGSLRMGISGAVKPNCWVGIGRVTLGWIESTPLPSASVANENEKKEFLWSLIQQKESRGNSRFWLNPGYWDQ